MKSTDNSDYNPADRDKPFNYSVNFCHSAHEATREEQATANANLERLIQTTKETISNE